MPFLCETREYSTGLYTHVYSDDFQFSMRHDEWLIKENISQLRQLMSDQNLQLLPDYEQRIAVLKDLGFIDQNSRVELKGKVACEVSSFARTFSRVLLIDWCRYTRRMSLS